MQLESVDPLTLPRDLPHPSACFCLTTQLPGRAPLLRGYNTQVLFDEKVRNLPKPLYKRLKYYRSYLTPGLGEVRLRSYYAHTLLDGKKDVYKEMLLSYIAACGSAVTALEACVPEPEDFGMVLYDATTAKRFEANRE